MVWKKNNKQKQSLQRKGTFFASERFGSVRFCLQKHVPPKKVDFFSRDLGFSMGPWWMGLTSIRKIVCIVYFTIFCCTVFKVFPVGELIDPNEQKSYESIKTWHFVQKLFCWVSEISWHCFMDISSRSMRFPSCWLRLWCCNVFEGIKYKANDRYTRITPHIHQSMFIFIQIILHVLTIYSYECWQVAIISISYII